MNGIAAAPIQMDVPPTVGQGFCRTRRVIVLLAGIVVLSLADLVITMVHLRSTGMAEANPIARFVIGASQSPLSLICFKALSVMICVVLLYKVRKTLQGEIAAWCALLILAGLSLMWFHYARQYESPLDLQLAQSQLEGHMWVQFE